MAREVFFWSAFKSTTWQIITLFTFSDSCVAIKVTKSRTRRTFRNGNRRRNVATSNCRNDRNVHNVDGNTSWLFLLFCRLMMLLFHMVLCFYKLVVVVDAVDVVDVVSVNWFWFRCLIVDAVSAVPYVSVLCFFLLLSVAIRLFYYCSFSCCSFAPVAQKTILKNCV